MSSGPLRYKEDRRAIAFLCLYFGFVTAGFVLWPLMDGWQMVLLAATTCLFSFFNATIVHNAMHVPVFKARRHNRWFQYVMSLAFGSPVSAYVHGHNLSHHLHTQTHKDMMRTSKVRFRWNLLNALLFFFVVGNDIRCGDARFVRAMKADRPGWHRQFVRESLLVFATMAALLLLNWKAALLFFVLPHIYGLWGIIGVNYLQHDGADPDSEIDHSRDFTGPLLNWWTFNNGFHTIHHLQPGLHWSLLPAAHEEQVAPFIHPGLPQPSLPAYVWRSFVWPGRRVDFRGKPFSPPPAGADEDWIPGRGETPAGVSLGAED